MFSVVVLWVKKGTTTLKMWILKSVALSVHKDLTQHKIMGEELPEVRKMSVFKHSQTLHIA